MTCGHHKLTCFRTLKCFYAIFINQFTFSHNQTTKNIKIKPEWVVSTNNLQIKHESQPHHTSNHDPSIIPKTCIIMGHKILNFNNQIIQSINHTQFGKGKEPNQLLEIHEQNS